MNQHEKITQIIKNHGGYATAKQITDDFFGEYEQATGFKYADSYKMTGLSGTFNSMIRRDILGFIYNRKKNCKRVYYVK